MLCSKILDPETILSVWDKPKVGFPTAVLKTEALLMLQDARFRCIFMCYIQNI